MELRFSPLFSGSSGNATYVGCDDASILVDAGLSGTRVIQELKRMGIDPARLDAILVTHEHIDHIRGIAVLSRKHHIPVYANADTWGAMETALMGVYPSERCVFESDKDMYLGRLRIFPFTTPHDAAHSVGFTLFDGENK
jgi:phosphoribosyl 1,2-cyclic phosphodiesterase